MTQFDATVAEAAGKHDLIVRVATVVLSRRLQRQALARVSYAHTRDHDLKFGVFSGLAFRCTLLKAISSRGLGFKVHLLGTQNQNESMPEKLL